MNIKHLTKEDIVLVNL